jgi:uncharacterized protein (TIGR00288 family)
MNEYLEPLPQLGRMMAFVDGENLVARYQAMLDAGRTSASEVHHKRDVYVWSASAIRPALNVVQRATFYTYVTGNDEALREAAIEIQSLTFVQYSPIAQSLSSRLGNTLYPRVFTKQKNRSGKGVDIQMAVDVLCHAYGNNLDTVYLVSGDGDYEPLIAECQRRGKNVVVAALSSGLSSRLPLIADRFIDLDSAFFNAV